MARSPLHLCCAVCAILLVGPAIAQDAPKAPKAVRPVIEVKLTDDTVVKLTLLDEQFEFQTAYGKLTIPAGDVRRIDLGFRVPDDTAREIAAAVADLGSNQYQKREEAMTGLLAHREKAYPALKAAAKSTDAEVAKRSAELIERLQVLVAKNRLDWPESDMMYTDASKISGKILSPTLKVRSFAFGELQLKLSDCVTITVLNGGADLATADTLNDPGSMAGYQGHVGRTFVFRVVGAASGSVWGTETYTLDSTLALAAVHAGVLKQGQTGNVRVTILGPSQNFIGSTQNGVTSSNYASYPGAYKILPR
ncbi:LCCL domain-containing protein [Fimbriiglobus ruber]|uniref:LCCL domain-containing protein n=1 Tax=Fimbriiglobus ruber TaxID=1908690 RepID=A0A225DM09_9BACT|nr:LCCL domain-containing protein [Fimbriiglobus ruber]OWK37485.1 hypothetical protein FRUB_06605 [Fimbriiglobus ruber]